MHQTFLAIIDSTKYIYYLGTTDVNQFVSCFVFGYIGVIAMILMDIGSRDPNTNYSPAKFSWKFFLEDNVFKLALEIILVALVIRFLPQFLNSPMNQFNSLLVGLGADRLAAMAKTDRDKLLPFKSDKDVDKVTNEPIVTAQQEAAEVTKDVVAPVEQIVEQA